MSASVQSLAGCIAGSVLGLALLVARGLVTGTWLFLYLPWNLALAWVPLGLAWLASRFSAGTRRSPWIAWLSGFGWLLFFPNSPYILTDLQHLILWPAMDSATVWFDLTLNLMFALTGLMVGMHSLAIMHHLAQVRYGRRAGWGFVVACSFLAGAGVYLGRYQRWNSWDLFRSPVRVLGDVSERLLNPLTQARSYLFSILFAAMVFLVYLMVRGLSASPSSGPGRNVASLQPVRQ